MIKLPKILVFIIIITFAFFLSSCEREETTITDELGFIYQDSGDDSYIVFLDNLFDEEIIYVPSSYNGKPIISVGTLYTNFESDILIEEIIIPEGITGIQQNAFYNYTRLRNIILPESISRIGGYAFYNCASLVNLIIPEGVTIIEDGAFSGCSNLESLIIPSSVTTIERNPFVKCYKLTNIYFGDESVFTYYEGVIYNFDKTVLLIYLPANTAIHYEVEPGVITIGEWAFASNDRLVSVNITNDVVRILDYAFIECNALEEVTIDENVISIGRFAFSHCDSLGEVDLSEGLGIISDYAFYMSETITSMNIPKTVNFIGVKAFNYCTGMTDLIVDPENPYYQSIHGVLYSKDMSELIFYPPAKTYSSFTVPSQVKVIKESAFEACYNIWYLYISEGVEEIEREAFIYNNLMKVYIPLTVKTIGSRAFYGYSGVAFYCEAEELPSGWSERWIMDGQIVYWDREQ